MTNNSRFLILPERSVPNLASKVLRLTLDRLPTVWQSSYGHPGAIQLRAFTTRIEK